jgi:formyl-CoA transferase
MTESHAGLGRPGAAPVRVGADVGSTLTALFAFDCVLAALVERAATGRGQRLSISQFATLLHARASVWAAESDPDEWDGWAARPFFPPDYGYPTADGAVYIIALREYRDGFARILSTLDIDPAAVEPRFRSARDALGIGRFAAEFKATLVPALLRRTRAEVTKIFQEEGIVVVPLWDYADLFGESGVARHQLVPCPDGSTQRYPDALTGGVGPQASAVPDLGQHSRFVLTEFGGEPR